LGSKQAAFSQLYPAARFQGCCSVSFFFVSLGLGIGLPSPSTGCGARARWSFSQHCRSSEGLQTKTNPSVSRVQPMQMLNGFLLQSGLMHRPRIFSDCPVLS